MTRSALYLHQAFRFALERHGSQNRKGSPVPYIVHPLAVSELLAAYYPYKPNLVIAGVLHDLLEDTVTTADEIEALFGYEVRILVQGVTAEKGPDWRATKQGQIDKIRTAAIPEIHLLKAADLTHNARSVVRDANASPDIWTRFGASVAQVAWYYESMVEALHEHIRFEKMFALETIPSVREMLQSARRYEDFLKVPGSLTVQRNV